jgi:type I restriction enzyme M protein
MVKKDVETTLPKRGGVTRPLKKEDFAQKSAMFLREESQYEYLLNLPEGADRADAIIKAMTAIEEDHTNLAGVLPKDYQVFDSDLLASLLKTFNDDALNSASGDVFGRIYEYFLMKFAMAGAQDNGEFFTPVSLVQTIVNVIEPDHGVILDPACGSGGMFVQTSHFLEKINKDVGHSVTFFGQEKTTATIRLAKMNLAVHGLEGNIAEGNTFYDDKHSLVSGADFVMANPPFNVDEVDAEKVKGDVRLPFGLPGINKNKKISNGNYLWISYFNSYLNAKGRAGFVMSSQASSAGHGEKDVRQELVKSGDVDIMISIRSNFFYTRSVPCELWFFDKGKTNREKVLMLDARNVYRKVTRKVFDFSPEQLKNLTAVVWLYRGRTDDYLKLISEYFFCVCEELSLIKEKVDAFDETFDKLSGYSDVAVSGVHDDEKIEGKDKDALVSAAAESNEAYKSYKDDVKKLQKFIKEYQGKYCRNIPKTNDTQKKAAEEFESYRDNIKGLIKQIDLLYKLVLRPIELIQKSFDVKEIADWDNREVNSLKKKIEADRKDAVEQLRLAVYFYRQIHWLQSRFPSAEYTDVEGLVKLVDISEIEKNDWSLTPGRYVGVAPVEEDEDFDFEETMREIHTELASLNEEAVELASVISANFEGLGI